VRPGIGVSARKARVRGLLIEIGALLVTIAQDLVAVRRPAILVAARLVVVGRRDIARAQISIARLRLVARGHHAPSVSNSWSAPVWPRLRLAGVPDAGVADGAVALSPCTTVGTGHVGRVASVRARARGLGLIPPAVETIRLAGPRSSSEGPG
jgi:hypothetical protein